MTSNYDDNTEEYARCTEDAYAICRHVDCLKDNDGSVCSNIGRPEAPTAFGVRLSCLLPPGHGGMWHRNNAEKWSACRRHPACDCGRHEAKPHKCPEPELLIVNEQLMRDIQGFIDNIQGGLPGSPYDTLRLILDKMEKGFRIP